MNRWRKEIPLVSRSQNGGAIRATWYREQVFVPERVIHAAHKRSEGIFGKPCAIPGLPAVLDAKSYQRLSGLIKPVTLMLLFSLLDFCEDCKTVTPILLIFANSFIGIKKIFHDPWKIIRRCIARCIRSVGEVTCCIRSGPGAGAHFAILNSQNSNGISTRAWILFQWTWLPIQLLNVFHSKPVLYQWAGSTVKYYHQGSLLQHLKNH